MMIKLSTISMPSSKVYVLFTLVAVNLQTIARDDTFKKNIYQDWDVVLRMAASDIAIGLASSRIAHKVDVHLQQHHITYWPRVGVHFGVRKALNKVASPLCMSLLDCPKAHEIFVSASGLAWFLGLSWTEQEMIGMAAVFAYYGGRYLYANSPSVFSRAIREGSSEDG